MSHYVVIDAFPVDSDKVLLIHKNRPEYLKGLFLLPGGKLEGGETPIEAALRELKEESGLDEVGNCDPMVCYPPEYCGKVYGTTRVIHCVKVPVSIRQELKPREGETEPVAWFDCCEALNHPKLMPNLRVVLPLMRGGARGWEINVSKSDWHDENHKLELSFLPWKNTKPIVMTVKGLAYYEL